MKDEELVAELKTAECEGRALEKLLERIIWQRPVSRKRQLERELKNRSLIAQQESLRH